MTNPTIPSNDPRVSFPIFGLRDAAKYLGMAERTFNNWARGTGKAEPLITTFGGNGRPAIPFIGFAEAYALNALRRAGVPLQRIRPAVAELQQEIGLDHALASKNLATDGAEVLHRYAGDAPDYTVVRTKQRQFRKAIEEHLRPIHYGTDGFAQWLELPLYRNAAVIVDPRKAFGHPLLRSGRARVEDIVDRFGAGESIEELASDYRISREEVEDVIRVETLAKRPAPA